VQFLLALLVLYHLSAFINKINIVKLKISDMKKFGTL